MFVNGKTLLKWRPIVDMLETKERFLGTSYGLSEAGYDIRIKQDVEYLNDAYGDRVVRTDYHPDGSKTVEVFPGNCVLASSIEEFNMPMNLAAEVKDKSTHARNFLGIFNTAIEPGWCGFLTMELVFNSSIPYTVKAGQGIAQIRFQFTTDEISYGAGKYQNAGNFPQPAIVV